MKQGKIPLLPVFAEKCKCIQKFRITWTLDRMITKDLHHKFFIFFPTLINDYTYPAFHIIKTGFVFFLLSGYIYHSVSQTAFLLYGIH